MASAADRFSTLQKVGIFLIVLGPEKARDILDGVDVDTLQRHNATIEELGELRAEEKAAVMIEFGDFFYKGKEFLPISKPPPKEGAKPRRRPAEKEAAAPQAGAPPKARQSGKSKKAPLTAKKIDIPGSESTHAKSESPAIQPEEEKIVISALKKLRERVDPQQINWGKAGYDFGEGFKGPAEERR